MFQDILHGNYFHLNACNLKQTFHWNHQVYYIYCFNLCCNTFLEHVAQIISHQKVRTNYVRHDGRSNILPFFTMCLSFFYQNMNEVFFVVILTLCKVLIWNIGLYNIKEGVPYSKASYHFQKSCTLTKKVNTQVGKKSEI